MNGSPCSELGLSAAGHGGAAVSACMHTACCTPGARHMQRWMPQARYRHLLSTAPCLPTLAAWVTSRYLYQNNAPGVQDYLANKLQALGEPAIDKYLLQFVYLAVSRPNHALERTIIELCSRSFRISIKVRGCAGPTLTAATTTWPATAWRLAPQQLLVPP